MRRGFGYRGGFRFFGIIPVANHDMRHAAFGCIMNLGLEGFLAWVWGRFV